jgi:hypothetical protein
MRPKPFTTALVGTRWEMNAPPKDVTGLHTSLA